MTLAGDRLSEEHRLALLRLRNATLAELLELWPTFRLDDVAGTWPAFAAAVRTLIEARRAQAVQLGTAFVTAHRALELGIDVDAPEPVRAPTLDDDRTMGTLTLLGPIMLKRSWRRGAPNPADLMLTRIAGTTGRLVLEGDRDTVAATVAADRAAVGWRRVTSASPCDFCADLAARDIVSDRERTVAFEAHDHCGCAAQPIYRRIRR